MIKVDDEKLKFLNAMFYLLAIVLFTVNIFVAIKTWRQLEHQEIERKKKNAEAGNEANFYG